MFKGFYNLTSGMLTQGRALDVLSNNIANVSTAGFKADRFTASTFQEVMWQIVGNKNKEYAEIGEQSWITMPRQLYTDYTQGAFDQTDLPLDFAIEGRGYFAVEAAAQATETEENPEDEAENAGAEETRRLYTRGGSFSLDGEGYLTLPGHGRVLSAGGQPIQLTTDKLQTDGYGGLFTETWGFLGRIGVFVFEDDETALEKNELGLFEASEDAEPTQTAARIHQGMLERSNVDWVKQMTEMLSTQRAYQSAAELAKIYDTLMTRITTEIGRLT